MSYLVLARKYRPQSFSQMVGQDHVVRAICNALESGRLHHAYLFTGTRGVGKTTVSRILAKSLNCIGVDGNGGVTSQPCGMCEACRSIDAGHFVDYTELDAASNRGVEDVQALLDQAAYKPVQGRYKVFMIDEVHMLSNTAFNAMLKTLEEPPEFLKFVLATTDPQKVPVTVLSRCLQFALKPMAPETITAHLAEVLKQEAVAFEFDSLDLLARAARGSMRDALSLTDQAIAYGAGALQVETVRMMLGAVDTSYTMRILEALADGSGAQIVGVVNDLRANGLSATMVLDELADWLSRIATLQVGASSAESLPQGQAVLDEKKLALAQRFAPDELQFLYSICLHGKQDLGWASDEYAALTMVLLRYLAFHPSHQNVERSQARPVSAATEALTQAREQVAATVPPSEVEHEKKKPIETQLKPMLALPVRDMPANSEVDAPGDKRIVAQDLGPEHEKWLSWVQRWLEQAKISAMVRELAVQSQCIAWTPTHLTLRVEQTTLTNDAAKAKLQELLREEGQAVHLVLEVGPVQGCWASQELVRKAQLVSLAQKYIEQSPLVGVLTRDFGGKILPQSIEILDEEKLLRSVSADDGIGV